MFLQISKGGACAYFLFPGVEGMEREEHTSRDERMGRARIGFV